MVTPGTGVAFRGRAITYLTACFALARNLVEMFCGCTCSYKLIRTGRPAHTGLDGSRIPFRTACHYRPHNLAVYCAYATLICRQ
jgi:hypothetical protein